MNWLPEDQAPENAWPVAVSCKVTCDCHLGSIVVMMAARIDGQWVIDVASFQHSFDIVEFLVLPIPTSGRSRH